MILSERLWNSLVKIDRPRPNEQLLALLIVHLHVLDIEVGGPSGRTRPGNGPGLHTPENNNTCINLKP